MSERLARIMLGAAAGSGSALPVFPAYCTNLDPRTVQITGEVEFTGLEYCGPPGTLAVGRVLLLRIPDGSPIILGNLS